MDWRSKSVGYLLVGFSVILFFVLALIKIGIDRQSAFLCEKFHENNLDMAQCPAHKDNSSWTVLIAFGTAFLIFGTGIYILFIPPTITPSIKKEFKEVNVTGLDDEERKIYEIAKNKSGLIYQSDLIKETALSKVRVTRILDRLEAKDILERKRRGMTNIIVLK